jgi:hypothetical protein
MSDPIIFSSQIPVSAPMTTDSAGTGAKTAFQSIYRVVCSDTSKAGTSFAVDGSHVVTAEHVVRGSSKIFLIPSQGDLIDATLISFDDELDLAILEVSLDDPITSMFLSNASDITLGSQVSTWGFPDGYYGRAPILSVGYLAGVEPIKYKSGKVVQQWVVNAAFNRGNSGGPLLLIDDASVIGVVVSKIAPISPEILMALDALSKQRSGFIYTRTFIDGKKEQISEGQIIAEVLNELRGQVQLVVGRAIKIDDLTSFLKAAGI